MVEQDISQQGIQSPIEQRIADAQPDASQDSGDSKDAPSESSQISSMISDLDRRLRILEERYGNLRKKIQLTDQNMIEAERSFGKELRGFSNEMLELKRSIVDFDEKVVIFGGEMDNVAQKTDLKIIEKYLAMWNPGMFVTRKELKEYLKSKNIKLIEDDNSDNHIDDEDDK
jgi:predicted  nucleic acid-binding Zn-ribbon protein